MKGYVDNNRYATPSDIQVGDLTSPKRCNHQDHTFLWGRTAEDAVQERHQGSGPKAQWQLCHKDHGSL